LLQRGAPLVFIREFEFVPAKTEVSGSSLSLASPKGVQPKTAHCKEQ
jgi:hypothetical protein